MKTTYEHYGSHCIIRETIICEENVVIVITRCVGGDTPEQATNVEVKQFPSAPDAIMKFLGLEKPHYFVEPGAWYTECNFVAYNEITGLLVIEIRKSLNI